jgi:hypothetical protein
MKVFVGWLSSRQASCFVGAVRNQAVPCIALSAQKMQYFVWIACVLGIASSHSIEYRYVIIMYYPTEVDVKALVVMDRFIFRHIFTG